MSTESIPSTSSANSGLADAEQLAHGRLGVTSIVGIVVSAVAPVSTLAGGSAVLIAVRGGATPASFLIAGLLYALFCVGYVAMSRHLSNAGGFVAYVSRAFGPRAATATAGISLLFYLSSLIAFYSIVGVVTAGTFGWTFNPAWVSLGTVVIVGIIGVLGIGVSARLLLVLLALEVIVVAILDVGLLAQGGPEGRSLAGFGTLMGEPNFGVSVLLCMICFSGLEATVVFSEEAKQPRRDIPRAVFISLVSITLLYTITSWLLTVHVGPTQAVDAAAADPSGLFFTIASDTMGGGFGQLLTYLVISSFIAMFVGFQSMISRYVFALGRAGALPAVMGRTSSRSGSPLVASLTVTGVAAAVLIAFNAFGADPISVTYAWLVGLGTVGLLVVLTLVSASVFTFFLREAPESNVWVTRVAPAAACVALVTILYLGVSHYDLLGASDDSARLLLLLIPAMAAIGWTIASIRRRSGTDVDYSANLEG